MLLTLNGSLRSCATTKKLAVLILWLAGAAAPAWPEDKPQEASNLPKYDLATEMKTKGVVDEVKPLQIGSKEDTMELTVKSGSDVVHLFLCPKAFEEEMGITIAKGDELAITGSKVKREGEEIVLVREVVKGNDTLIFRDDKGKPVWDWRTGK